METDANEEDILLLLDYKFEKAFSLQD